MLAVGFAAGFDSLEGVELVESDDVDVAFLDSALESVR